MRDKNRIYEFVMKLCMLWMRYPDTRFGQLVADIAAYGDYEDLFYVEDGEILGVIEAILEASAEESK